jgi:hypothetical protein
MHGRKLLRGVLMQNKPRLKDSVRKIENYLSNVKDQLPILRECCLINDWDYDEFIAFSDANPKVKRAVNMLLSKKEVFLEKAVINKGFNKIVYVFLLQRIEDERAGDRTKSHLETLERLLAADAVAAHRAAADDGE